MASATVPPVRGRGGTLPGLRIQRSGCSDRIRSAHAQDNAERSTRNRAPTTERGAPSAVHRVSAARTRAGQPVGRGERDWVGAQGTGQRAAADHGGGLPRVARLEPHLEQSAEGVRHGTGPWLMASASLPCTVTERCRRRPVTGSGTPGTRTSPTPAGARAAYRSPAPTRWNRSTRDVGHRTSLVPHPPAAG